MGGCDDDTEYLDGACPKCGHHALRTRCCDVFDCEDGWIDEYHDDPINFSPGEEIVMCRECFGTGRLRWCSDCGNDLTFDEWQKMCATRCEDDYDQ